MIARTHNSSTSAGRRIRESESDSDPIRLGFGFGSDWVTIVGFGFGLGFGSHPRIRIRIGLADIFRIRIRIGLGLLSSDSESDRIGRPCRIRIESDNPKYDKYHPKMMHRRIKISKFSRGGPRTPSITFILYQSRTHILGYRDRAFGNRSKYSVGVQDPKWGGRWWEGAQWVFRSRPDTEPFSRRTLLKNLQFVWGASHSCYYEWNRCSIL